MQLVIDTLIESPQVLRLAANFLLEHAALRDAMEGAGQGVPMGTRVPSASDATGAPPPPPPPPPPPLPPGNVVPFPPPPPSAPLPSASTAAAQEASTASPTSAPASALTQDYDSAGVPFDPRIHQANGNKKKDGTFKIKKRIDPAFVSAVMKELAPRIRGVQTPLPVGASAAPVSLPQTEAPAYDEAARTEGHVNTLPPPPPPPPSGALPPPPPPPPPPAPEAQASAANAGAKASPGGAPPVDPYRALLQKIIDARRAEKITAEEVAQICASVGAPSVSLLNNMPELVPQVDFMIDDLLRTR